MRDGGRRGATHRVGSRRTLALAGVVVAAAVAVPGGLGPPAGAKRAAPVKKKAVPLKKNLVAKPPVTVSRPAAVGAALAVPAASRPDAADVPPDRFLAQLYTEGLGRVPTQAEWSAAQAGLAGQRCDAALLGALARPVLTGSELAERGYTREERVLVTVRALLGRDPSGDELRSFGTLLDADPSSRSVLTSVSAGPEFAAFARQLCDPSVVDPGWGAAPPPLLPAGDGLQGSQAAVQRALDRLARSGGGVLELAPRALVEITAPPLVVPAGVVLTTAGAPAPRSYARMARLVRVQALGDDFDDSLVRPVVQLQGGAALRNVWVDGQRARSGRRFASFNVMIDPGNGTALEHSRIDNAAGATNVQSNGTAAWGACVANRIVGNLVQSYASNHTPVAAAGAVGGWRGWTDGLSIHCEDTLVEGNSIVDATDVGIITFADRRADEDGAVQRSVVRGNVVVNVGNSAYAALAADAFLPGVSAAGRPVEPSDPAGTASRSFVGNRFEANTVWTGDRAHFHLVLSVGTGAWFGDRGLVGRGVEFRANTTGTGRARASVAVAVANMVDALVAGNAIRIVAPAVAPCPSAEIAVTADATGARVDAPVVVVAAERLRSCLDEVRR